MAPKKKQSMLTFSGSPTAAVAEEQPAVAEEQPQPIKRRRRSVGQQAVLDAALATVGAAGKKNETRESEPPAKIKRTRKQHAQEEGAEKIADAETATAPVTPPVARARTTPASPRMGPETLDVFEAELEQPELEAEQREQDDKSEQPPQAEQREQDDKSEQPPQAERREQDGKSEQPQEKESVETLPATQLDTGVGVAQMKETDLFGSPPGSVQVPLSGDRQPSFSDNGPSLRSMMQSWQGGLQPQAEIHSGLMSRFGAGQDSTEQQAASPATTSASWSTLSSAELKAAAEETAACDDLAEVQLMQANPKCTKCQSPLDHLKTVMKGKQRPTLVCCFCNRSAVMLQRHLNWPTTHFTELSAKAQADFWAECSAAQVGKDGSDNGLKYGQLRAVLKSTLTRERIVQYQTTEGGEFQPLGFYATKGYSAAINPLL